MKLDTVRICVLYGSGRAEERLNFSTSTIVSLFTGFGLPHTDERFWNKNLGNCLDYTEFPATDKQPALMNFAFLYHLYGLVPGASWNGTTDNATSTTAAAAAGYNTGYSSTGGSSSTGSGGQRTSSGGRNLRANTPTPDRIFERWQDVKSFERRSDDGYIEGRLLHENEFGMRYELDLGQGYKLHVGKLLVRETND